MPSYSVINKVTGEKKEFTMIGIKTGRQVSLAQPTANLNSLMDLRK